MNCLMLSEKKVIIMDKVKIKTTSVWSTSVTTIEVNGAVVLTSSDNFVKPFMESLETIFKAIGVEYEIEKDNEEYMGEQWWGCMD